MDNAKGPSTTEITRLFGPPRSSSNATGNPRLEQNELEHPRPHPTGQQAPIDPLMHPNIPTTPVGPEENHEPSQLATQATRPIQTTIIQSPGVSAPIPTQAHTATECSTPSRRSTRSNRGQSTRYDDYPTGSQYEEATSAMDLGTPTGWFETNRLYAIQLPPQQRQETWFLSGHGWIRW